MDQSQPRSVYYGCWPLRFLELLCLCISKTLGVAEQLNCYLSQRNFLGVFLLVVFLLELAEF